MIRFRENNLGHKQKWKKFYVILMFLTSVNDVSDVGMYVCMYISIKAALAKVYEFHERIY